jgi:hypothetical protein
MSAPTGPEIREAIAAEFRHMRDAVGNVGIFTCSLWDVNELQQAELARLDEIVDGHVALAEVECRAIVDREFTAAALEFAREFPEAPRPGTVGVMREPRP